MEERLNHYELLDHLGRGGMADVWRACDRETGRILALKVFEPNEDRPPELARRLRDREVRMLVSVQHPNIVQFYDMGNVEDDYYFAMEFVENSLLKRMRRGDRFSLVDRVLILRQTTSALAAIHHQGIVHRDVKPGNILLDEDPSGTVHVKLTDLGIAKSVSETDIIREQMPTHVPGTAKYLCPEQIRLEPVDGRADIFSLGVVAYELLTGKPPFIAENTDDYLRANAEQNPTPAHEVCDDVPEFLGRMVQHMLAKNREERYDSDTLLRDLELAQQHLISGAELVERVNPASLFYEMPETEMFGSRRRGLFGAISPISYALAGLIVLAGLGVAWSLWPQAPGPGPIRHVGNEPVADATTDEAGGAASPDERPASGAVLVTARDALAAGRAWEVLALLGALDDQPLTAEERAEVDDLLGRARRAVAEQFLATAEKMLAEGRVGEAEVVLAVLREDSPADVAERLDRAIAERRSAEEREKRLADQMADAAAHVQQKQYKEAAAAYLALLKELGGQFDRAADVRRALADVFDLWGKSLLASETDLESLEGYLATVSAAAPDLRGKPSDRLVAGLHLKVASHYHALVEEEPECLATAQRHYAAAMKKGDSATASRARAGAEELRRWQGRRAASETAAELQAHGFKSRLWRAGRAEGGGSDVLDDGTLRLRTSGSGTATLVYVETPLIDYDGDFRAGLKLHVQSSGDGPGTARAGWEVRSSNRALFQFVFDGMSYRMATEAIGAPVCRAFGDEGRRAHELGLSYDSEAGRITLSLDGEQLRSYELHLADVRLRVFLWSGARTAWTVEFQDFSFEL